MAPTVSAILTADRFGGALFRAIAAIEAQLATETEIIVLAPDDDPRVGDWWHALGRRPHLRIVHHSAGEDAGSARNRAVRAGGGAFLFHLEAGDWIDPHYLERALQAFDETPEVSFVTSWSRRTAAPGQGVHVPAGCDASALVGDTDAIHTAAVYRRGMWDALGGFDETLPGCERYDFWLRAVEAGHRGVILPEVLFGYGAAPDSVRRTALDPERRVLALAAVIEKHREVFERHAADALCCRERILLGLARQRAAVEERRRSLAAEGERLGGEVAQLRTRLAALGQGGIDFGELRRTTPFSDDWGFDRGVPVDRVYIERFLRAHAGDIQGIVLEVKDTEYASLIGGEGVARADTVDIEGANRGATFIADLRSAWSIPSGEYDCVILTQTIHIIDDMRAVIAQARRVLKPGGVLLATMPAISRVGGEGGAKSDLWRVTDDGARHLFGEIFPADGLSVRAFGNVLTATTFLYGLAAHELTEADFEAEDPRFQVLVGIRAVKPREEAELPSHAVQIRSHQPAEGTLMAGVPPSSGERVRARGHSGAPSALILGYHRVAYPGASDIHGLCTTPDDFWNHLAHLKSQYQVVRLATIVDGLAEGHPPDCAVAVTLDDGYLDALTAAAPILADLKLPATFFVTSAALDGPRPFWWDVLEDLLLGDAAQAGRLPDVLDVDLPGGARRYSIARPEDRLATHWSLYHALLALPPGERDVVVNRLCGLASWEPPSTLPRPLTVQELRRLAARPGVDIGAHGADHLNLAGLSARVRETEIRTCKARLEQVLGVPVPFLAYAFGSWSGEAADAAAAAGFRGAVTTDAATVRSGASVLALPRLTVGPWDVGRLAREAATLLLASR